MTRSRVVYEVINMKQMNSHRHCSKQYHLWF